MQDGMHTAWPQGMMHPWSLSWVGPAKICLTSLVSYTMLATETEVLLAGTFVDGEGLEKGGKRKLEPGKSVVTIGRAEMTLRLLRKQAANSLDRRGNVAHAACAHMKHQAPGAPGLRGADPSSEPSLWC